MSTNESPPMTPDRLGEYALVFIVCFVVLAIVVGIGFGVRHGMRCTDNVIPLAPTGTLGQNCDRSARITVEEHAGQRYVVCRCPPR